MKPIEKDELYEHLGEFLRNKGIELKEGQYSKGIHAGCSLLADAINLSQAGLERAKSEVERQGDQIRHVIHQKTAPKGQSDTACGAPPQTPQATKTAGKGPNTSARKTR